MLEQLKQTYQECLQEIQSPEDIKQKVSLSINELLEKKYQKYLIDSSSFLLTEKELSDIWDNAVISVVDETLESLFLKGYVDKSISEDGETQYSLSKKIKECKLF